MPDSNDWLANWLMESPNKRNPDGPDSVYLPATTPSGRTIRYEISGTDFQRVVCCRTAVELAERVFDQKYRDCEWDRKHREVNVRHEIVLVLAQFAVALAFQNRGLPAPVIGTRYEYHMYYDMSPDKVSYDEEAANAELQRLIARDGSLWSLKTVKRFAYPGSADNHGDAVVEED